MKQLEDDQVGLMGAERAGITDGLLLVSVLRKSYAGSAKVPVQSRVYGLCRSMLCGG
jgi:hypothetical protein